MKKQWKIWTILLTMISLTMLLGTAASAKTIRGTQGIPLNLYSGTSLPGIEAGKTGTIKDIKSSNPTVVQAKVDEVEGAKYVGIMAKKYGSATVSYKIKKGNKTDTYIYKIVVYKYANPFKTFKIGNKNCTSEFKKTLWGAVPAKTSGKVNIKVKSGWKIVSIRFWSKMNTGSGKKIKQNAKVTYGKNSALWIQLRNTKKNFDEYFFLGVPYTAN